MAAAGGPVGRSSAWRTKAGRGGPGGGAGAQRGRGRRPEPAIPATSAAWVRNRNVFWCPRSPGWAALCRRRRRVTSNGQSSASGAERIASRTARATWGWQRPREGVRQVAHRCDLPNVRRVAGFGQRERRRRRCGGNGGRQASAASHPSGSIAACEAERDRVADNNYSLVKDGTLAKHPFRSGATLSRGRVRDFTGSRGQAIAGASGVLRPQACAGLRRVSPAYAVQTRPGTCLEPGQRVWGAQFTGSGPVPHRQAGRQGRLWHCVSTDSITQKWRKARGGGESVGGWRGLREIGGGGENWELGIENYEWKAELKGAAG